jgi:hypothetical protein
LADIAHFHLFSRDRERGIMDSLRYQGSPPIGEYVALMLADIAHFHLFSRDRERGIMDSLRYQANVVDESADEGNMWC